jgi:hypothetical protein
MISVEDVPDEAVVVHPSGIGSIAPSEGGKLSTWDSTGEDLSNPNHRRGNRGGKAFHQR